jgi:hypothetical protein
MNKSITLTFPHSLPQQEARRRIEQALVQMEQQAAQAKLLNFRQTWQGDRLNFVAQMLGQEVSGFVDVLPETVAMEVTLPGFLAFVADAVRGRLQNEGRKLLGKNASS